MSGSPSAAFMTQVNPTKASSRAGSDVFNTMDKSNMKQKRGSTIPNSLPALDLISRKTDDNKGGRLDKLANSATKDPPLTTKNSVNGSVKIKL